MLICTLGRPMELRRCLQALVPQAEAAGAQVIVVDNSADGDARSVVAEFPSVEYGSETRRGSSFARNAARRLASGTWIAYLDDDAVPRPDWLERVRRFVGSGGPDAAGGLVVTVLPPDTSRRVRSLYRGMDDSLDAGREPRLYRDDESPGGGNCVVRAAVFDAVGGFDERISLYFDDVDFFARVRAAGHEVAYDPSIVIDHLPPKARLTLRGLLERGYQYGRGPAQTKPADYKGATRQLAYGLTLIAAGTLTVRYDRLFGGAAALGRAREMIRDRTR